MAVDQFAVTYDYRCPFARNAHEHVVAALRDGAPWGVRFAPFSLSQAHVEDGQPPVWDSDNHRSDLLAVACSIVVRDRFADRFLDVHMAMFAARHDHGRDLRQEAVLVDVLQSCDVDASEVLSALGDGWPIQQFRREHEAAVAEHQVFGVPTFIVGNRAAFVRLMNRPEGDGPRARSTIGRVVDLIESATELNELKHTSVPL
jgi:protein-disulfide isomerase-like protein with CxxC motif